MTKAQIQREITTILLQMGIPEKAITKKASFYKDLGLDSLDFTELIMECELRLNLNTSCTDVEQLKTLEDTVEYVNNILHSKKQAA